MKNERMLVFTFVFCSIFAGPLFAGEVSTPTDNSRPLKNIYVREKKYEGVIFTCAGSDASKDTCWVPSEKLIQKMEHDMDGAIHQGHRNFSFLVPQKGQTLPANDTPLAAPLEKYKRQYFGEYEKGRKIILVNLFCYVSTGMNWKETKYMVLDGGNCFIRIKYDVESGKFFGYEENGEA